MSDNQNPEQRARDHIDDQLRSAGWVVQRLDELNPSAAHGVINDSDPFDFRGVINDSDPFDCALIATWGDQ